ncbi:hypothetical protein F511_37794 [Dorcoceras hygrometricum]|uniref:Uncharacterized protein n=1 Tax=Dorcoceras hygrometricum TaxID=472368 RepID=A0A2Z7AP42_9LAMI|nr:hypothetical protein F511_37794 [Dorcoceras hygrometricum]
MENRGTCGSVIGQMKKVDKTRRTWTAREEEVLVTTLKDVITKGWKSENGFKAGNLTLLEFSMHAAIPDITKVTMNDLVNQLSKPDNLSNAQDVVLDALRGMNELSEDKRVIAAQ